MERKLCGFNGGEATRISDLGYIGIVCHQLCYEVYAYVHK